MVPGFLSLICTIAPAMIYFVLLRPVSKELNLLATFFRLVSILVEAVAVLNLVAALFPKVLGILIQVAGVGYLTNGLALILYPAVANQVFLAIIVPAFRSGNSGAQQFFHIGTGRQV